MVLQSGEAALAQDAARRSQTADLIWERFIRLVDRFFPPIKTLHPLRCNLRIELRWSAGDPDNIRTMARELVDLHPDAILGGTTL